MARHTHSPAGDATAAFVSWLVTGAVGPALVALPVNFAADKLAGAAVRWFKRFRQTDDLSRLVKAAAGASTVLSRAEINELRRLLEHEETWHQLAGNDVTRLTGQIAGCLPRRDDWTAEDARAAAQAIARGLLEFAVFDLQPEVFQKVAVTRLQQMTRQASALDESLLRMHKDLYALVDDAKDLFRQVMDRLPPGPADLNEIKIYLKTLVNWLNTDPWPRDRLGGPVLTPAVIERKLWVSAVGQLREQDIDADELGRRCSRLVILGDSGSGKTWLAMRTARICAEEALKGLEGEATLDEVELPLYTTCSRLTSTFVDFREAAVSSALNWLGDLGGSRIIKALRRFFTERDKPTLLVIDSLDEASDASLARDRLRQADSLDTTWRVVLTSRRSSWNNQLNIEKGNQDHRVGELQPLRYPEDVEAVLRQWFASNPERGQAIAAELSERSDLRQAATVPLILAFFCILGGSRPLPEFRHDLYRQVINRMLHGPWRPGSSPPPDLGACRSALRKWAWQGAESHPVSGVGKWKDDIATEHVQLSAAGQDAVDHIATPQGGPDFDTEETSRRFVHRSLQEHLAAEHVGLRMPAEEAAAELLNHLWYDPDWEYAAPAALAMHPHRDQVLKNLIARAMGGEQFGGGLVAIDGFWEFRGFLARVALESGENDWLPETAKIIGQARLDLARTGHVGLHLIVASNWPTWNGQIIESLLQLLARETDPKAAQDLAEAIARLDPSAEERARAREQLLALLSREASFARVLSLADPSRHMMTAARRSQTRKPNLADAVAQLAVTPQERAQARALLLDLLDCQASPAQTYWLADAVAQLAVTPQERAQARALLLDLLDRQASPARRYWLTDALARLAVTAQERAQARGLLLDLLDRLADAAWSNNMADTIALLDPSAEERARVKAALLNLLGRLASPERSHHLAGAVVMLDPSAEERAWAREKLLNLLDRHFETRDALRRQPEAKKARRSWLHATEDLFDALDLLGLPEAEAARDRAKWLSLLDRQPEPEEAEILASRIAGLDPSAEDGARARAALLKLLDHQAELKGANRLAFPIHRLGPPAEERARVWAALLDLLGRQPKPETAQYLPHLVFWLGPPAEERARARARAALLVDLVDRQTDRTAGQSLVNAVARLSPGVSDLGNSDSWLSPPTPELLAAARQNSGLHAWIAALPQLSIRVP